MYLRLLSRTPSSTSTCLYSTALAAYSHNTQTTFPEGSWIQRQIRCKQITSTKRQAMKMLLQFFTDTP